MVDCGNIDLCRWSRFRQHQVLQQSDKVAGTAKHQIKSNQTFFKSLSLFHQKKSIEFCSVLFCVGYLLLILLALSYSHDDHCCSVKGQGISTQQWCLWHRLRTFELLSMDLHTWYERIDDVRIESCHHYYFPIIAYCLLGYFILFYLYEKLCSYMLTYT